MQITFIMPQTRIPLYPFLITGSFLITLLFLALFLKKKRADRTDILLFCLLSAVLAVTGAKALTMILALPKTVSFLEAGMTSYGGAAGVLAASVFYEKLKPSKGLFLTAGVLSLPLLYGLSKTACFFAGCCYGLPYEGPGCVVYPGIREGSFVPVQLLECVVFVVLFFAMLLLESGGKRTVLPTIALSAAAKFLLDFLRFDHVMKIITLNQWISLLFFTGAVLMLFRRNIRRRKNDTI